MKKICVFCGSSQGALEDYIRSAKILGTVLGERNITLVYGGAKVGTMGELARACLEAGGKVAGVIHRQLVEMGVAFTELESLHIVDSMHQRKAMMVDLAEGFIALPGGLGGNLFPEQWRL